MNEWKQTLISTDATVLDAMRLITTGAMQIALVVDESHSLLGVVTDGDIRRGILAGHTLESPVKSIMNQKPTTVQPGTPPGTIRHLMQTHVIQQIPIVDDAGRLVGLETAQHLAQQPERENWVFLMAGGQGMRLRPLTDDTPKPLLEVGDKPILQTIFEQLIGHGFRKFFFAVNYKSEQIKDHFGSGNKWGGTIEYIEEREHMGTAGALGLLPTAPSHPMLVMNADILTAVDFDHLLRFHDQQQGDATVCVREYDMKIPYGVVKAKDCFLAKIVEKPVHRFFVNAGIYVVHPRVLPLIPPETHYNMTDLLESMLAKGMRTAVFPVHEYWIDIGQMEDYHRANSDFKAMFAAD